MGNPGFFGMNTPVIVTNNQKNDAILTFLGSGLRHLWNTITQTHTKTLRMNQVNKHKPIRNNKNDYSPRYQMDVLDTG